ncbi:MAG: hypothetical protein IPK03_06985 [Bacteroidetes bacterium]|nr:hypothetical protein [Bacteroidota bacterium]
MSKILLNSIFCILLLNACSKSSSSNTTDLVQQGNLKITLYNDGGKDETYYFTGYVFTFSSGKVTATKSGSSFDGTLTLGTDDSQKKFILTFASSPLDKLNDDWHIAEETSTKIRLEDVSGGGGGTDLLTFEKN